MKRRTGKVGFALVLALTAMLAAIPVYAADESEKSDDLELQMEKDPMYVLTIPKENIVQFDQESPSIGDLIISGDIGTKQKVTVTVVKENFVDTKDPDNVIPFTLRKGTEEFTTEFWERDDVKLSSDDSKKVTLTVDIPAATRNTAAPGLYKGKLIFKAVLSDRST